MFDVVYEFNDGEVFFLMCDIFFLLFDVLNCGIIICDIIFVNDSFER